MRQDHIRIGKLYGVTDFGGLMIATTRPDDNGYIRFRRYENGKVETRHVTSVVGLATEKDVTEYEAYMVKFPQSTDRSPT